MKRGNFNYEIIGGKHKKFIMLLAYFKYPQNIVQ